MEKHTLTSFCAPIAKGAVEFEKCNFTFWRHLTFTFPRINKGLGALSKTIMKLLNN